MKRPLASVAAAAVVAVVGAAPAAPAAEDPPARAFLEWAVPGGSRWAGESVPVTLRVGVDAAFFSASAAPLSPRPMDVPVHVRAPGFVGDAVKGDADAPTFALDDDVVAASRTRDETRDGRTFRVLEVVRRRVLAGPGEVVLAAPTLRYSWAARFDVDALGRRVPADRREETVTGAGLALHVLPLPAEGRPAGFGGAVGHFTVRAAAAPAALRVGDSLRLTLDVEGEGNLGHFEPPPFPGGDTFHVFGRVETARAGGRTFLWDLTPLSAAAAEIPPIPFAYFDPGPPGEYRVARTEAIPLRVTVPAGGAAGVDPPAPAEGGTPRPRPPWWRGRVGAAVISSLVSGLFTLVVVGLLKRRLTRGRPSASGPPGGDRAARVRTAAAAFEGAAAAEGADLSTALANFLAAALDCPPAAVVSPDLAARLRAAGVPADGSTRTAALLERLVAARYGGGPPDPGSRAEAAAMVRAVETALAPAATTA